MWVGIEVSLEDEAVGRHGGIVEGVRYFTAAPKRGLFARPMWVTRITSTGHASSSSLPQSIVSSTRDLRESLNYRRARFQSSENAPNVESDAGGWTSD